MSHKEIFYSDHLKFKLKLRGIAESLPGNIYKLANEKYYDKLTGHFIAMKDVEYKGKIRDVIVSYDESEKGVTIISIHPIKTYQKINRVKAGRWKPL